MVERVAIQRQNHVFKLVKNHLSNIQLPILDSEYINSWENLELILLKLEDAQFEILYNDRLDTINKEKEFKKKLTQKQIIRKDISKNTNDVAEKAVPLAEISDPFIREMERMFRNGDQNTVFEILKTYEK